MTKTFSRLSFFPSIKLGVIEDTANRSRLSKLLRFYSSADDKKQTSLADYVSRMKEKQQNIYYLGGASLKEVLRLNIFASDLNSPFSFGDNCVPRYNSENFDRAVS
jgi:HSP90 family molecular chaperone